MKKRVLIVEDDKFFRFAIKKFVDWESHGFEIAGEAVHGAAALEFVESQPVEVVVTDMSMPVMNGIELTAMLREKHPDILIIALSAYDDFEFVKESLKLGASDYILKQDIEKEDIGEIISSSWNKHMAGLAKEGWLQEEILKFLKGGKLEERAGRFLDLSLDGSRGGCLFAVRNLDQEWKGSFGSKNCWLEESLLELHEKEWNILLVPAKAEHSIKKQIEYRYSLCARIESLLKGEDYLAGCSSLCTETAQLPESYAQARKAAVTGSFLQRTKVLSWDDIKDGYEGRTLDYMEKEESYKDICSLETALKALDELTEKMRDLMPDEEHQQRNCLLLLNAAARNLNYPISNLEFARMKEHMAGMVRLDDLVRLTGEYLEQIFNKSRNGLLHSSVAAGIQFMRQNYGRDICLHEIAEHAALNESYFSNLFKKETGQSITEYLNKIRIEKAKELIARTNLKNYEIAERVGIMNASYFSTIFKKETGLTVQEYRQRLPKNLE